MDIINLSDIRDVWLLSLPIHLCNRKLNKIIGRKMVPPWDTKCFIQNFLRFSFFANIIEIKAEVSLSNVGQDQEIEEKALLAGKYSLVPGSLACPSVVTNLKTASKTEMEFSDVKYDINLKDIFTERYLHKPPWEAIR